MTTVRRDNSVVPEMDQSVRACRLERPIVLAQRPPRPRRTDTTDAFLPAMLVGGEVDHRVTGERRAGLLQRGRMGRTRIATPALVGAEAS